MSELLEALAKAAPVPSAPKGFDTAMTFTPGGALDTLTLPLDVGVDAGEEAWVAAARKAGVPIPEDMTLQLVEARMGHNQAAWHRDKDRVGENHTAYTAPNTTWHYRFKVVPKSLWRGRDYDALMKDIRKAKGSTPRTVNGAKSTETEVILLGDFQVGKRDYLGGTPELLERSEAALAQVLRKIRKTKPAQIVLIDVGDSTEGFASAPNAAQTNDLDMTEQITVWRRILWRWIAELAKFGVPVEVLGVPSNHCRVRSGKNADGKPNDDWGLQTIGAVADMASVNPDAYGHVSFYVPETYDEHLALTLVGGKTIGAFHGHQKSSVPGLLTWLDGQAAGRSPVGHADIVFAGHYHHLEVNTWGDDRWLFVAPTMDSGSSWYSNLTGRKSRTGVLTLTVDEYGWRDLAVAWA
jgi:hypothetical protein